MVSMSTTGFDEGNDAMPNGSRFADLGNTEEYIPGITNSVAAATATTEDPKPKRRIGIVTILGLILVLAGLGVLSVVAYQYYSTGREVAAEIAKTRIEVKKNWNAADGDASLSLPGAAFAIMRIPYFGPSYEVPIVVGVDLKDLDKGIGWFSNTAKPGQIGNFAVAGHNGINNNPFSRLLELPKGSKVIVETRDDIYTYEIDKPAKETTVPDTDTWVLEPDPIDHKKKPTVARITMVTCTHFYLGMRDRSVAFGHLVNTEKKHNSSNTDSASPKPKTP